VWSLLIQSIVSALVSTIYIWLKSSWRPKMVFNFRETKPLFNKGFGFMGQGLVDSIFTYAGTMVIGKVFSPGVLGIYDRGSSLSDMPQSTFVLPITRPLFPVFSKLQDDRAALKEFYIKILRALNWALILVCGILLLSSNEIIYLLLGEKWMSSAPYFFLLSLVIPLCPNWAIITALWKGLGLVKKVTFVTFVEKLLFLLAIPALFIGLKVYAICIVGANLIANILKSVMNASVIGISVFEQYQEWLIEILVVGCVLVAWQFCELEVVWLSFVLKTMSLLCVYTISSECLKLKGYIFFKARLRKFAFNFLKKQIR
ncbi:MAG: oligosaccharide flippase family protein, partial [Muribaculaceae bacterium]|nr:oligosaccharide flippase family protein [Muribaculaceae bacterium]